MICHWCTSTLVDPDGQPRWNLFLVNGFLAFVCCDGCVASITRLVQGRSQRVHYAAGHDDLVNALRPTVLYAPVPAGAGRG